MTQTDTSAADHGVGEALKPCPFCGGAGAIERENERLRETLRSAIQPLEHAAHVLDGVTALDEEDEGADGGSATCQAVLRTVKSALKRIRAVLTGGNNG